MAGELPTLPRYPKCPKVWESRAAQAGNGMGAAFVPRAEPSSWDSSTLLAINYPWRSRQGVGLRGIAE